MNSVITVLFFYFPWFILLIKTQNPDNIEEEITNNPPVSNSNEQQSVNTSLTYSKNQYALNSEILRDPSIPLFKTDDEKSYIAQIFNVLFRLENSFIKFIKTLEEKNDSVARILLDLYRKVITTQKETISITEEKNNLGNILSDVYPEKSFYIKNTLFYFLRTFLTYMVDFNHDKDSDYFRIEYKNDLERSNFSKKSSRKKQQPSFFLKSVL
ncbi:hypothetical protein M153_13700010738 [Pseudoloma neurophilia]|uniref:Uncharacterized protein n=1 Tax=Pseudoloma neurophilia TaxID=146866 RepID=A0A0R0M792_9MICR|nr:hypothetical protein M153_13700010738 [Pseudoloma neurophilia]